MLGLSAVLWAGIAASARGPDEPKKDATPPHSDAEVKDDDRLVEARVREEVLKMEGTRSGRCFATRSRRSCSWRLRPSAVNRRRSR